MKMKMKIHFILFIILLLNGCFDNSEKTEKIKEETHTVDWFLNNLSVLDETLKKCNNNPGELLKTPNCQNAYMAKDKRLKRGKFVKSTDTGW